MGTINLSLSGSPSNSTLLKGGPISSGMFGVNFLAGFETGDTVAGGATYDDVIRALGNVASSETVQTATGLTTPVASIRFPGGSLTEDFYNNNALTYATPVGVGNGTDGPTLISDFTTMCKSLGADMSFVMPTIRYLSISGLGVANSAATIEMKNFVTALLQDAFTKGVNVNAIELGNEYWGESITTAQYGQIAAKEALVIQQAIDAFKADKVAQGVNMTNWHEPSILLQMGTQWGDSGDSATEMSTILAQFTSPLERAAVDGFVNHYYMGETVENAPSSWNHTHVMYLDTMAPMLTASGWKPIDQLEQHISEWNVKSATVETGLRSFAATVDIFNTMARYGVDSADFWSVEDRTQFSLTRHSAGTPGTESDTYLGLSFTGEAFRMLTESVQGMQVINLAETNSGSSTALVQAFTGGHEVVLFISNRSGVADTLNLNLSGVLGGQIANAWGTLVGTSGDPLDQTAAPLITNSNLTITNGVLSGIALGAYETLRVTVTIGAFGEEIMGYTGADSLNGSAYGDMMDGRDGNDSLYGLAGNDTIYGHDGNDAIFGGDGDRDLIYGGAGNDSLDGGSSGASTIYGDAGNDTIGGGNASNDVLYGGAGNDFIGAGTGDDTIDGGAGIDTAYFWGTQAITVNLGLTTGQNTGYGVDTLTSIEILKTGSAADSLSGGAADEQLYSYAGNDTLRGNAGNDVLDAGVDNDLIYGGTGNDKLYGGDGLDKLYGDAGNDSLYGGAGIDSLYGGSENDFIQGGTGNDILYGGTGADEFYFAKDDGVDKVYDYADNSDKIHIGIAGMTFANLSITGTTGNVVITYDAGDTITLTTAGLTVASLTASDFIFG